jgi:hypothetical protein
MSLELGDVTVLRVPQIEIVLYGLRQKLLNYHLACNRGNSTKFVITFPSSNYYLIHRT